MNSDLTIEISPLLRRSDFQTLANILGEKFQLLAPAGSSILLKLEPRMAICQIKSRVVDFFAHSEETIPESALQDLDHQIMLQITSWKAKRFTNSHPNV